MAPTNIDLIQMHLEEMLRETNQYGNITWGAVIGYCLGYYGDVTMDHVVAIMELQRIGAILK